jgi:hypothetical protein
MVFPDLKEQWDALFPGAQQVGEFVAILRDVYSFLDDRFGQSDGSRTLWISVMAVVVTVSAIVYHRVGPVGGRVLAIVSHIALQMVMMVIVGAPWLLFPVLNWCVVRGHFRFLSVTLVATAFVTGWGTHCTPEGSTLTRQVSLMIGWGSVSMKAAWCGLLTFSAMTAAIGLNFV